jgi:H/ACA ribonucleoprotein complex subunit 3
MKDICGACSEKTSTTIPMRFSMDDRYGKYRRMLKKSHQAQAHKGD